MQIYFKDKMSSVILLIHTTQQVLQKFAGKTKIHLNVNKK